MWHEARKHERKLRGMMVDYKKRAERRREYYEKIVSAQPGARGGRAPEGRALGLGVCQGESPCRGESPVCSAAFSFSQPRPLSGGVGGRTLGFAQARPLPS